MALTDAQKYKVVSLLGWPARVIDPTSVLFNSMVNSRLTGFSTAVDDQVIALLSRLATLDDRLLKALDRAGVEQIDDIKLNGQEMDTLRRERNRVILELSTLLDIPKVNNGSSMGNICV